MEQIEINEKAVERLKRKIILKKIRISKQGL